ncbi:HD-like signal output (HDOD) domain, no enzymatic activity [Dyella jiangningensis]|uniref:HDOD domain-containing protein n=1 Tax=Dyella sp. AtDHG13 TaxID=1938897 RepID=UPI000881E4D2|nr:HDOD domain-containing protein [Dyella sp. AtDHG13]PXV54118.1 HD-like signal output (HDOD) protein [Dyella sp. AtDHG13]SDL07343.1 HD-like signal output (HDOD) domain, no enzymatic activity [Dyella jiangningensis]
MMGNWWRVFGRERAAEPTAARPAAPDPELAVETLSPHPTVPCDEIAERFFRFILNLPVDAGEHANKLREQAILQRLREQCESGRFDIRSLPRMPTVLPQLMRAMKSDKLSGAQLADLIKRDPVLVGEVMRVTGSVTYRTAHPIGSLQHAVVLLGQIGLRHVVTSYVMKPILLASAGSHGQIVGQRLWDHAERCAHAAVYLSKGQCDAFEAYLLALVGYSGLGAVARLLDKELQNAELPASSSAFIDDCVQLAAQLTVQAGQHWELPPPVQEALQEHAQHGSAALALPMSRVLHVAQRLAMYQLLSEQGLLDRDSGYGDDPIATFPPQLLARCQQDLRQSFDAP